MTRTSPSSAEIRIVPSVVPVYRSTVLDFGIFDHFERPRDVPLDQAYEERLRLLNRADELGYYAYHLAEHHQSPLCMAPSQNVFLAAAARGTRRIKLGTLVHLLPMYHPLRFIEEICMLDNLSQGRLQIGLGRGITAIEHTCWGLHPEEAQRPLRGDTGHHRAGSDQRHARRTMAVLRLRQRAARDDPRQRPHPPFWYASKTPDDAASEGLNYVTHPGPRLPQAMARYKEVWDANRHRPDRLNAHVPKPIIGSSRHIVVADTDAEAERIARAAWPVFQDNFSKRGMVGPGPETRPDGSMLPVPAWRTGYRRSARFRSRTTG